VSASAEIGVVVATRDRRDSLLRTLGHLAAMPERPPVVVVDNASTDGSADAVIASFPDVEVIALERNRGAFARNLGAGQLRTPLVAFCDDDSWWRPGALARAAECFRRFPRLGLLAARTLVGPEHRLDPVSAAMGAAPRTPGLAGPAISGFLACSAAVRRRPFLAAGGFCERFLIGAEEQLLAIDLRAAGWDLCYVDAVEAEHWPDRGDRGDREWLSRRNALWTSWMRMRPRRALGDTAAEIGAARRDAQAARALRAALQGLPWALRMRWRGERETESPPRLFGGAAVEQRQPRGDAG
jgi:GT2 family glycosyltransferase